MHTSMHSWMLHVCIYPCMHVCEHGHKTAMQRRCCASLGFVLLRRNREPPVWSLPVEGDDGGKKLKEVTWRFMGSYNWGYK